MSTRAVQKKQRLRHSQIQAQASPLHRSRPALRPRCIRSRPSSHLPQRPAPDERRSLYCFLGQGLAGTAERHPPRRGQLFLRFHPYELPHRPTRRIQRPRQIHFWVENICHPEPACGRQATRFSLCEDLKRCASPLCRPHLDASLILREWKCKLLLPDPHSAVRRISTRSWVGAS